MTGHDPHIDFIVAAYVVTAAVIGSMIVVTLSDYRALKKALARFGERDPDGE